MHVLVMTTDAFVAANVFFLFAVKNVVVKNGVFTKFIYSDALCMMSSLFFHMPFIALSTASTAAAVPYLLPQPTTTTYGGASAVATQVRLFFEPTHPHNALIIRKLFQIEHAILQSYAAAIHSRKTPVYRLYETLMHGNIYAHGPASASASASATTTTAAGSIINQRIMPQHQLQSLLWFFVKCFGVWESASEFGLTYKFVAYNASS